MKTNITMSTATFNGKPSLKLVFTSQAIQKYFTQQLNPILPLGSSTTEPLTIYLAASSGAGKTGVYLTRGTEQTAIACGSYENSQEVYKLLGLNKDHTVILGSETQKAIYFTQANVLASHAGPEKTLTINDITIPDMITPAQQPSAAFDHSAYVSEASHAPKAYAATPKVHPHGNTSVTTYGLPTNPDIVIFAAQSPNSKPRLEVKCNSLMIKNAIECELKNLGATTLSKNVTTFYIEALNPGTNEIGVIEALNPDTNKIGVVAVGNKLTIQCTNADNAIEVFACLNLHHQSYSNFQKYPAYILKETR